MVRQTEAYVVKEPNKGAIETVTWAEELEDDELYVQIIASGICHADVLTIEGEFHQKPPVIPGHEGSGIVVEVGKGLTSQYKPGDHVVLAFGYCGSCKFCERGEPAYCPQSLHYNFSGQRKVRKEPLVTDSSGQPIGGFYFAQSSWSRYAIVRSQAAIKLPTKSIEELRIAAVLTCGVMTGASSVYEELKPTVESSMAIWGTGSVGLAMIMMAKVLGVSTVIAIDIKPLKLELAKELGATHTIDASKEDVKERIMAITNGSGVDFAIAGVGGAKILEVGLSVLDMKGVLFVITMNTFRDIFPMPPIALINKGLSIRGTTLGNARASKTIPMLYNLWKDGRFPIDKLATQYPFEKIDQALEDLHGGKSVKCLLTMT